MNRRLIQAACVMAGIAASFGAAYGWAPILDITNGPYYEVIDVSLQ